MMLQQTRVLILLSTLLCLCSCGSNKSVCDPLAPFNGSTYGDLAVDDVQVRTAYKGCAKIPESSFWSNDIASGTSDLGQMTN